MKTLFRSVAIGLLGIAPVLASLATPRCVIAEEMVKGNGGKVRMLYTEAGTTSYLTYTLKKFELDKKYGIEIVPTTITSPAAAITAMQAGAGEVTNFGWNDIARARAGGYALVGVTPWLRWGADFYVVQKDSPIKTIPDLKGKKIGTTSKVTLNHVLLMTVAKDNFGIDLDKDAITHEGAQPLLRGLLEQGSIDAAGMFNSVTPAMLATGKFRSLLKVSDLVTMYGLPDTPYLLYAFDSKYAEANPNNVKAFVRAYEDAIKILKTNDEVWLERGRQLQQSDEVSKIFMEAARTDLMEKFDESTEKNIRMIFDKFLPIAGEEAFGIGKLDTGFMTLAYQ